MFALSPATLNHSPGNNPPVGGDGKCLNSLLVGSFLSPCLAYHAHTELGIDSRKAVAFNLIFNIIAMLMYIYNVLP